MSISEATRRLSTKETTSDEEDSSLLGRACLTSTLKLFFSVDLQGLERLQQPESFVLDLATKYSRPTLAIQGIRTQYRTSFKTSLPISL